MEIKNYPVALEENKNHLANDIDFTPHLHDLYFIICPFLESG